jgi:site-specific DNA-cytosine methylase
LENVAAITSKGLDQVLKDIAALGYDAKWLTVRASDVGAPHIRDRWFCLATLSDTNSNKWSASGMGQNAKTNGRDDFSGLCAMVSDTDIIGSEAHDWWSVESNVCRVANGIPNRVHRLRGLGNAQVPLQAAVAYRLLGG